MKYLLFGDDTIALRFRKQELIDAFSDKHSDGQVLRFDFREGESLQLEALEEAFLPALFEVPKIVIAEGLGSIYPLHKERVENIINTPSTTDTLFIEAGKLAKTDAFYKFIKKAIDKEENYEAKKRELGTFIQELQKDLGTTLDKQTLTIIQARSGKDDELTLQNIQKVLTYADGSKVSSEELDQLVPDLLETKVFDALDALVSGKREQALTLFSRILALEDIFRIFPLCAWQIRQMLLVTEAKEEFGNQKEKIAKAAGMHPFVVQKLLPTLPHFSRARLARGLKMLAELDVDLKLSKRTPEGALQHFIFHW